MKAGLLLLCRAICVALIWGGCALLPISVPPSEPNAKAMRLLTEGDYVEAFLTRRFADGRILVRLTGEGGVWMLDPKVNCLWCWTHVDKRIWVKIDKRSARALNTSGETAEFWNGGPVDKY
ncbi:MAG: hypothetical protein HOL51_02535 [Gemmatimonadetes bacterium]|jgi:hypothetical protein|nr:hypothetical protein [Gemmatimonadota bacterium]MBT5448423.1 hypothetical protein [Gemmatimonadota bacterium]MBT5804086.1 hypothetical protein [Gemmatimonadota bacterium]MBT6620809.1 hypothetical protein [Gemmatimonadota bacterium]MBT6906323.1 hypothetical protein [Gemmatimonadota bacterium]